VARIKVKVTADDIRQGRPMRQRDCPVALAMQRATGLPVRVHINTFSVGRKKGRYPLPRAVARFVCNFDDGLPVRPSSFTVDVPATGG
jgi:hypothetical protein